MTPNQTNQPNPIYIKPIHKDAAQLAREHVNSFAESLITYAKTIAHQEGANEVQSNHINAALEMITREPKRKRTKEIVILLSSGVFGFAIQSFVQEANNLAQTPPEGNVLLVITYAVITLISVVVAVWAILT